VAIRYPRAVGVGADLSVPPRHLEIGRAETLRNGSDVVFVAVGRMVQEAKRAAELLAAEGIEAGVVNARFVKPLDVALLMHLANRYPQIVTVEDNAVSVGFGAAVLEALSARGTDTSLVHCIGLPDRFIEHGETTALFERYGLSAPRLAEHVRSLIKTRAPHVAASDRSR
ncbi:1-deoxy-D-xylulose-5-phosphate synthase, partial [Candidatus Sumerlaeota bacterium]|nr:1-deoxy-D-xylulose-5-phosphate synthase [Candidatus Sumerlaeota bacterium]